LPKRSRLASKPCIGKFVAVAVQRVRHEIAAQALEFIALC
jgi:hypothetical protein